MTEPASTNPSGTSLPTLASREQAIRDEADRNAQHAAAAAAAAHVSHVNTPPSASDIPFDPNSDQSGVGALNPKPVAQAAKPTKSAKSVKAVGPDAALDEHLDEQSRAALKLFNDRVVVVLEVFEDYRAKAQAGNLTADDEKRTGAALEYMRALVATHKPMPSLPQMFVK